MNGPYGVVPNAAKYFFTYQLTGSFSLFLFSLPSFSISLSSLHSNPHSLCLFPFPSSVLFSLTFCPLPVLSLSYSKLPPSPLILLLPPSSFFPITSPFPSLFVSFIFPPLTWWLTLSISCPFYQIFHSLEHFPRNWQFIYLILIIMERMLKIIMEGNI